VQKILENRPDQAYDRGASNEAGHGGAETPDVALTTSREEGDDMAATDSTPGKSPAFQFYPKDFLTDQHVELMSLLERGAYITLICKCWIEGSLPADVERLARLCGAPLPAFRKLWPAIQPCFRQQSAESDRLVHPRLEKERKKQRAFRRRQSDNGKKGGRPPRSGKPTDNPSLSPALVNPHKSFALSDLRSADSNQKSGGGNDGMGPDERIRAIAFELREIYAEVFAACRPGSVYRTTRATEDRDNPNYYAVAELYPDIRKLRGMLEVFLKLDTGNRPGTPGQFRNMAPECAERLHLSGWKATA
jgi:uncharacterized protein YdaU (DUF1376 family)